MCNYLIILIIITTNIIMNCFELVRVVMVYTDLYYFYYLIYALLFYFIFYNCFYVFITLSVCYYRVLIGFYNCHVCWSLNADLKKYWHSTLYGVFCFVNFFFFFFSKFFYILIRNSISVFIHIFLRLIYNIIFTFNF